MTSVVAWRRILGDEEVVCAVNTDVKRPGTAWVRADGRLHNGTATLDYRYTSHPCRSRRAPVEASNGRSVLVSVPTAGRVVLQPTAA
ncbi:MAG TPA: hypothetical protein VES01_10695 [Dermatophilaceae bacterium]|nr:hypothetical protein [Dermatophilaceae bacterium]